MDITTETTGDKSRLILQGRFDFNSHNKFSDSYGDILRNMGISEVEVDMNEVSYLDSAALGMLLLFNERAKLANKRVALANCHGMVAQALRLANFTEIFHIR